LRAVEQILFELELFKVSAISEKIFEKTALRKRLFSKQGMGNRGGEWRMGKGWGMGNGEWGIGNLYNFPHKHLQLGSHITEPISAGNVYYR